MDLTNNPAEILRYKMPEVQRDCQSQVTKLIEKLCSWRDESHRQMSDIISYHRNGIDESFNNLFEEFSHLQAQVSTLREERDILLKSEENHKTLKRNAKLGLADTDQAGIIFAATAPDIKKELSRPLKVHDGTKNKDISVGKRVPTDGLAQQQNKTYPKDGQLSHSFVNRLNYWLGHNDKKTDEMTGFNTDNPRNQDVLVDTTSTNSETSGEEKPIIEGHILDDSTHEHGKAHSINEQYQINDATEMPLEKGDMRSRVKEENEQANHEMGDIIELQNSQSSKQSKLEKKRNNRGEKRLEKKVKCEQCPFVTVWKTALNRHIKTVHYKIRDHVCGFCGNSFAYKTTLQDHEAAIHTKVRKHVCKQCGFAAAQKSNIRTHMKAAHGFGYDESEQILHCDKCDYFTKGIKNLRRHRGSIHKVEAFAYGAEQP